MAGDGFIGFRPLPKRIDIVGPREQGVNYIGMAEAQLCILEDQMRLFGQNTGTRTMQMPDGTVVEVFKNAGMAQVKITTKGQKKGSSGGQACWCGCHVSIGYIRNVVDHGCPDMTDWTPGETWPITYDVEICKQKDLYTLLLHMLPMGFTTYRNGQKVMVVYDPGSSPYVPNANQGCNIVTCRITNVNETHPQWLDAS